MRRRASGHQLSRLSQYSCHPPLRAASNQLCFKRFRKVLEVNPIALVDIVLLPSNRLVSLLRRRFFRRYDPGAQQKAVPRLLIGDQFGQKVRERHASPSDQFLQSI